MFRPIRMDHTNCLQVAIKTIQFNSIDTSTRKQREEQKGAQRASKGGRPDKKSTAASTVSPAADDAAAGADA